MKHSQSNPLTADGKQKLNRLFAALRRNKLAARQNFSRCGNCGVSEISDVLDADKSLRGFAFYHKQDGARLTEENGTYITFGARSAKEALTEALGQMIVAEAKAAGLFTTWNGKASTRIFISEVQGS